MRTTLSQSVPPQYIHIYENTPFQDYKWSSNESCGAISILVWLSYNIKSPIKKRYSYNDNGDSPRHAARRINRDETPFPTLAREKTRKRRTRRKKPFVLDPETPDQLEFDRLHPDLGKVVAETMEEMFIFSAP